MFATEKDSQIVLSGALIYSKRVQSKIECAMQCTNVKNCCSSKYHITIGQCTLFYACCPKTEHMVGSTTITKTPIPERVFDPTPKDCSDLSPGTCSRVYTIRPLNGGDISVFCDMVTDDGGWTVIQKRFNGTISFDRIWSNYKSGFGDIIGEHWLGNDNLHYITEQGLYKVRLDFEDYSGNTAYAIYDRFNVGDEGTNYLLSISDYHGTAGDSMTDLASQPMNGMKFTTRDKDNDIEYHNTNCAIRKKGGWWFASCTLSNINGIYKEEESADSNHWFTFNVRKGLRKTKIMTKPNLEI
ncbi:Fibrinogen-like protein A,Angiopoietin-related protein 7,Angiopoietin-related protein 1,Ficolin-1-B,Techylectin-5A,Ficolin-2,Fibrinogen-like protein 1-like protein,Ryncolin-1,Tenascin-R,Fibrinogen-like protein 1,Fibrinogen C domain-containing protein 1-A,Tenascin-N,Ryncolin-3,Tenascin,Techylectin-like protein,Fibrinogen C domain-containing protein 1,Ryncolin-2,Techylectin-5B,Angiopoietin-related protein 2,Angiopoietin-2,Microfibril-associated glycoprotein 4,Ficolin-1,Fibrinogen C domain-containing protein|uniref:Fibrinogen C-terminal domain-containing protein n=1 Tax=Mytilus coruscus TaxID=42192 RepID=A0A6J8D171_MYTCO|nr:Fibrinogen-like protein A,Angiopoietin-related protein 7,Angiopoietin-related protein 1,Ficolin-1-B,Techylectin-5A,Ficolin-2,Fibrinogen-like protein 1-like protein,Ryncolin-1,Tenascin-R,Fibrinogen-like protein 1,Fibrinogen C domain-containing protein 1-A,Tenascin-N,Ryncolin-3,Tenascin,Techylectin-like protein,Fibrinogen C domain-containing protein 1,Ryncolin-2,Techylectin-5B,Angiopoietin-related protein 2,Angiopoietin-2,Microfibril-associated glycoprotein 4,Ficolin-1,Fibrinogen C domain-containi